jgi:hypothetical protein
LAWLTLPAQLSSPLDAVNVLISTLGEAPLNTISPPPTTEAQTALAVLNEVDLGVQLKGWAWNTDLQMTLPLAGDGTVTLPAETLKVVGDPGLVQRGSSLYDRINHTYTFTAAPKVDLTVRLDWDQLPQAARSYITLEAAQRFQSRKQGSQVVLQINAQDIRQALSFLEQQEDGIAQTNSINGNPSIVSGLYGIGGLRRNRT